MKRLSAILCVALLAACTKVETTYDHPVSAEFAPDQLPEESVSILYMDFLNAEATGSAIDAKVASVKPDLLLVATTGTVDGTDAELWISRKFQSFGHSSYYSSNGYFASSSVKDPYFNSLPLTDGKAFIAETSGWASVLIGKNNPDDMAIVEQTIQSGKQCDWLVISSFESTVLPNYAFSDCLAAQSGGKESFSCGYLYAAPGSWNYMGGIKLDGNSFNTNLIIRRQ